MRTQSVTREFLPVNDAELVEELKMNADKLREIAVCLERMPMFQFFLAGRELFHSNFLYWLFNSKCQKIFEAFGIPSDQFGKVEREKKNIDITVTRSDGSRLLIENKFKAAIDTDQLEEYTTSGDFQVILSPDKFEDVGKCSNGIQFERFEFGKWKSGGTWYHLGYDELIERLEGVEHRYIKDYVTMVRTTLSFLEEVKKAETIAKRIFWFDSNGVFKVQDQIAEEIKIQDMLQKRRAQRFAKELRAKLQSFKKEAIELDVRSNFTRKMPLVEAFLNLPNSEFSIGIQIQENQFRRCFLVQRSKQKSKAIVDASEPRLQGKWFRQGKTDPFLGGHFAEHEECAHPANTKELHQRFGQVFLYQYVKIGKLGLLPENLLDAVYAEIRLASEIAAAWSPAASSN